MHYIADGNGFFCGKEVKTGEGFLICPNIISEFSVDAPSGWEHFWIAFNGAKSDDYLKSINIELKNQIIKFKNTQLLKEMLLILFENSSNAPHPYFYSLTPLFVMLANIDTIDNRKIVISKPEQYVDETISFIKNNFCNNITVNSIARHINISEKYLCRIFHKKTGISPKEYIIETRLNYAEYLMRSTSLSLSEIAAQVGYSNLNNFSQIYIKYKKITPSKFRSLLNSEDKFDIVNKGHTKN